MWRLIVRRRKMTEHAPLFVLRASDPSDVPFIYSSWLKSYRDAPAVAGIPNGIYYAGQHALIERLLERSTVVVACSSDDPQQIMGYGVGEILAPSTAVLHWLYVKHTFRGFGIAKALEGTLVHKAATVFYTHRVKSCDRLMRSRSHVFNPFALHGAA